MVEVGLLKRMGKYTQVEPNTHLQFLHVQVHNAHRHTYIHVVHVDNIASYLGLRILQGWKTKAWYTLFTHAQHFNYNDVTFIYDGQH